MNTHFQKGDLVVCTVTGDAYDGANRVIKGFKYEVVEVINEDSISKNNGETGQGLIVKTEGSSGKFYPYVWKQTRFHKVVDPIEKIHPICMDDYTW